MLRVAPLISNIVILRITEINDFRGFSRKEKNPKKSKYPQRELRKSLIWRRKTFRVFSEKFTNFSIKKRVF